MYFYFPFFYFYFVNIIQSIMYEAGKRGIDALYQDSTIEPRYIAVRQMQSGCMYLMQASIAAVTD